MLAPHRKIKIFTRQPRASLDTSSSKTDDQDADGSSESSVLPSSTELFYFYGQSLEQCAKLSAGKPLYDLCNVHKKWLRIYAGAFVITVGPSDSNVIGLLQMTFSCLVSNGEGVALQMEDVAYPC